MSYHLNEIQKGVLGQSSKIREELEELIDAEEQGNKILVLNELSDIVGAIKMYLEYYFEDVDMTDLLIMSSATERAFKTGHRK